MKRINSRCRTTERSIGRCDFPVDAAERERFCAFHIPLAIAAFFVLMPMASPVSAAEPATEHIGSPYTDSNPEGILEPWKTCKVSCSEQGLLDCVYVKLGDRVQPGQVLAQLDQRLNKIQLDIATAQASASGRIQMARAEVELAERKIRSIEQAREKKYSTQSELDRAEAELKISRSRLQAEEDEAHILSLQAKRIEILLQQRQIVSPLSGVVEKIFKAPGEYISPNSPEVVQIVDTSKLRARFFLQLVERQGLIPGASVRLKLSDRQITDGIVENIAPIAAGESGLIEVQVIIENPEMEVWNSSCVLLLSEERRLVHGN